MPTLADVRTQQKAHFDEAAAILAKTGGTITEETSNEDRARLTELKATMLENGIVEDRLRADAGDSAYFKQGQADYGRPVDGGRPGHGGRADPFSVSVGSGVVASDGYVQAKASGQLTQPGYPLRVPLPASMSLAAEAKRAGMERKTLVTSLDPSGGAFVVTDRLAGYTPAVRGELAFLDVLPTQTTTSDLVEWVQQDSRTNAAAPVAEATASSGASGLKPESGVAFSVVSKPVETIATIIPLTTRILMDAPQLRSVVDDELLYMLRETLEAQCVTGNGASPNLLGINNVPGIQTVAAGANAADALFNAAMAVRFTGGVPATVAVVGVATMAALRLMRENSASGTLGGYLFGPPNMPGPTTVFGLEVVTAQAMPANTAFVLNATATTLALIERETGSIQTGWINDDFGRNIVRLLAELRAVLATRRPKGICKVTGLP